MDEPMDFLSPPDSLEPSPAAVTAPVLAPTERIFSIFVSMKAAGFGFYMFGWLVIPWTVIQWVVTIILCAADFWFTKNVAGRLILGMRWSNRVGEDGESRWAFEFVSDMPNRGNHRWTFWGVLYGSCGLWGMLTFFSVIRLNFGWFFVCLIGLALACSNAWGFMQCDKSIRGDASMLLASRFMPLLSSTARGYVAGHGNEV